MRIAFCGAYQSFDYYHVGGMDSFTRRLAVELICKGHNVSFVHFSAPHEKSEITSEGIKIVYFTRFVDALQFISGDFHHILTIYVPPRHWPAWVHFRKKECRHICFHRLYSGWPEGWIKRSMGFSEAVIMPYNGTLFCVSPRLKRYISKWFKHSELLLPPVPENYFVMPREKPTSEQLRITYMGRIDPGKGVSVVIDLFQYIAKEVPEIQTRICGYAWRHKPETMKLHEELLMQDEINYVPAIFDGYTREVDEHVRRVLRETDILFLPYEKLSSTTDTPLLLLEGMASLCVVVTRPLGDMPEIYGTNEFMLNNVSDKESCLKLFRNIEQRLNEERMRLMNQNRILKFSTEDVVSKTGFLFQNV